MKTFTQVDWGRVSARWLTGLLVVLVPISLLMISAGKDPLSTLWEIVVGGFGSVSGLRETLVRMTPLLLCALAAAIPAKAGLINIGGEGQLHMGAVGATFVVLYFPTLPSVMYIPLLILVAMAAAAIWAAIAGMLRAYWQVNEVLVCLMLNYVAIFLVGHLVHGPWKDPSALGWPYTAAFPSEAVLATLGRTNVHLGLAFGIVSAALAFAVLRTTSWGFSVRVIGDNPKTAKYSGVNVAMYFLILMAIGGAMAGLAGLGEVSVIQGRLRPGISPGYGYAGFMVAWLAGNRIAAIVPIAFLAGGLYSGADALQITAGLPSATVDIFMGLVFFGYLVATQLYRPDASKLQEAPDG